MKQNSFKSWVLAARPKTLTGAMIPVMLAGALAIHEGYEGINAGAQWIICLLFACMMQVAANFINDYYDFKKGTDREDRLGPERACAMGWVTPEAMRIGIGVTIASACAIGLVAVILAHQLLPWGGWEMIVLGILCVIFAFLYTVGLSYLGFGDLLVLVFFGFVPVCGTYYLMTQTLTVPAILLSLISGISIDSLLVINNYRDRDQDRISGKKTLAVRFGEKFERYHYLAIGILVIALINILGFYYFSLTDAKHYISWNLFEVLYFSLYFGTWREMVRINHGKELNLILGKTSRNMFLMALGLSLVIIFA